MSGRKLQERAVDRMIEMLRSEPIPRPCWDEVERKLFDRIARAHRPSHASAQGVDSQRLRRLSPAAHPSARARSGAALRRCMELAAIAAAITLAIGTGALSGQPSQALQPAPRWVDVSSIALAPGAGASSGREDRDLSALEPGDGIEAFSIPVSLARPGAVRWTLAPFSRAVIKAAGSSDVVVLERGSIRVEVTPGDPSEGFVERFAVEADQTRVAAHGTVFRVDRRAEGLVVEVEQGVVAVGPVGRGGLTTGHLLVGPNRALFSLDGARTARVLSKRDEPPVALLQAGPAGDHGHEAAVVDGSVAAADLSPEPQQAADAPRELPELRGNAPVAKAPILQAPRETDMPVLPAQPAAPSGAGVPSRRVLTSEAVSQSLRRCFTSVHGGASPSVRLSVSATLTLTANREGGLASIRFTPPLENTFQSCVWAAVGDGRIEGDAPSMTIPFSLP